MQPQPRSAKNKTTKPTFLPMNTTSIIFLPAGKPYLCNMAKVNIFTSDGSSPRVARRRHLLTLLTAVLLNELLWLILHPGFYLHGGSFADWLMGMLPTLLDTLVLMELSLLFSRLIIRLFWNRKYSFASVLLQNLLLLFSVIALSVLIAGVYAKLFPEAWSLSWDVFTCDSLVAYFLTSVFFISYLTNRYRAEATVSLQATVDRLKLKTDNHFVFNSLATLGSLIETDPAAAAAFNDSMCRMYRYIVSKGDARVVPLREELGFVDEYAKNLTLRHSHVHISVEGAPGPADAMIPPLALQGLIENVLKHNASGADRPLDIQLRIDNDTVTVSNNVQPLANAIPTTGTGLQTLSERYRLICGKEISVDATETRFSVRLPVIKSTDLYESLDH
jgi:hypothetical protein